MQGYRIRIAAVSTTPAMERAVEDLGQTAEGVSVVYRGTDAHAAFVRARENRALLLVDAEDLDRLPEAQRLEPACSKAVPTVLAYYSVDMPLVRRAMEMGVLGLIERKRLSIRLPEAARRVTEGEVYLDTPALRCVLSAQAHSTPPDTDGLLGRFRRLSEREREVFLALAAGARVPEIATRLGVSVKTVQTHQAHVYRKLEVGGPVDLFHIALRLGLDEVRAGSALPGASASPHTSGNA